MLPLMDKIVIRRFAHEGISNFARIQMRQYTLSLFSKITILG